jgi:hypothetical protein
MKCLRCNIDNTYKERTANMGRCKSCNHQFVFEPTDMRSGARLTDTFFAKLLVDISASNTLFFTPTQLYYLLNKRLQSLPNKNDWFTIFFAELMVLVNLVDNI